MFLLKNLIDDGLWKQTCDLLIDCCLSPKLPSDLTQTVSIFTHAFMHSGNTSDNFEKCVKNLDLSVGMCYNDSTPPPPPIHSILIYRDSSMCYIVSWPNNTT